MRAPRACLCVVGWGRVGAARCLTGGGRGARGRSALIEERAAAFAAELPAKARALENYEAVGRGFPGLAARYAAARAAADEVRQHIARLRGV